jgi:hypothetical protein
MRRILTLVLIVVSQASAGCRKPLAPPLDLPAADQIAEMRASVPKVGGFDAGPIPEFVVPPEHIPKVLFWLLPAEPDRFSVSRGVEQGVFFHVADITIRTNDGTELRLRCHDWGCNPVTFTPNGKDYYQGHSGDEQGKHPDQGCHDGGAQLLRAIKTAHEARQK